MTTLKKIERLCKKVLIDKLYKEGNSFNCYPFRVTYLPESLISQKCLQVLFSVSKKRFRTAVNRNLLKRRMREAYRLNKEILVQNIIVKETDIIISYNYTEKEILKFSQIEIGIMKSFQIIITNLEKLKNKNSLADK